MRFNLKMQRKSEGGVTSLFLEEIKIIKSLQLLSNSSHLQRIDLHGVLHQVRKRRFMHKVKFDGPGRRKSFENLNKSKLSSSSSSLPAAGVSDEVVGLSTALASLSMPSAPERPHTSSSKSGQRWANYNSARVPEALASAPVPSEIMINGRRLGDEKKKKKKHSMTSARSSSARATKKSLDEETARIEFYANNREEGNTIEDEAQRELQRDPMVGDWNGCCGGVLWVLCASLPCHCFNVVMQSRLHRHRILMSRRIIL